MRDTLGSPRELQLAFDVGHSSLGWAVLNVPLNTSSVLLGCGAVTFQADDCLASERRGFRRQRRHIRATRLRLARLRRLLVYLGVLTEGALVVNRNSCPWLFAARVLRGGKKLTWSELWEVLRWYAHNRGYDGNRGWSRDEVVSAEDTEKEQKGERTPRRLSQETRTRGYHGGSLLRCSQRRSTRRQEIVHSTHQEPLCGFSARGRGSGSRPHPTRASRRASAARRAFH